MQCGVVKRRNVRSSVGPWESILRITDDLERKRSEIWHRSNISVLVAVLLRCTRCIRESYGELERTYCSQDIDLIWGYAGLWSTAFGTVSEILEICRCGFWHQPTRAQAMMAWFAWAWLQEEELVLVPGCDDMMLIDRIHEEHRLSQPCCKSAKTTCMFDPHWCNTQQYAIYISYNAIYIIARLCIYTFDELPLPFVECRTAGLRSVA